MKERAPDPMTNGKRILVIDDDPEIGELVAAVAEGLGWECVVTTTPSDFLEKLLLEPEFIFIDLIIPEVDGIELLRWLSQRNARGRVVLMSGVGKRVIESADKLARTLHLSVAGHLQKPFEIEELEAMLSAPRQEKIHKASRQDTNWIPSETELRRAIEESELVLHYQPQIDIASRQFIGIEALVRWQHPDRGLVFPDAYISHMESFGLITAMTREVIRVAVSDWNSLRLVTGKEPLLSVNASVLSLRDLDFPDMVLSVLNSMNLPPEKLVVEITETGLINDLASTLDVLIRLRMRQINLSIDDFGTGYSTMQQLRHIPATEVKIDRSFVQNSRVSQSDRVMVEKTIEIGHELGMRVTAEGVETEEELKFLTSCNCDVAQGYLFSRPLDLAKLSSWLSNYRP
jgi:EAL domain-containing protein (putative c-di-GMP-specific phosphodiesterase class I)/FixJ family two-component response regulator